MRIRRTLASLAVVTLASTTLAACGGGDEATNSSGSSSSSAKAGDSASSDASDTAEESGSGDLKELDRDGLVKAITENTLKAGTGHMTMSMGGAQGIDAEGDVDYTGGTPSMSMTMSGDSMGAGKKMELRFVDGIMYMSIPGMTPAGKFLKIDPKDKSNPMAKSMGDLDKQMDPLNSVKAMQAGVKDVKLVGPEEVDGTKTNHYKVTVDTKKMLASMGGDQSAAGMLPATLTYDMWLDSDDLLRQMVFDIMNAKTTMKMSDWGKKVDIQAPPASKIAEAPAGMQGQG